MVSHHDVKLKFDNLDFKCYQNTINKKIPLGIFLCNLDQYTYQLETLEVINF